MNIQIRQTIPAPVTTTLTGARDGDADVDDDEVDANNRLKLALLNVSTTKESTELKTQPKNAINSNKLCILLYLVSRY